MKWRKEQGPGNRFSTMQRIATWKSAFNLTPPDTISDFRQGTYAKEHVRDEARN
jgi:hypothetical protein